MFGLFKKEKKPLNIHEVLNHCEEITSNKKETHHIVTKVVVDALDSMVDELLTKIKLNGINNLKELDIEKLASISPLSARYIKNSIINVVRKELFNKSLNDLVDIRFVESVKNKDNNIQYLYINLKSQAPVEHIDGYQIPSTTQFVKKIKFPHLVNESYYHVLIDFYMGSVVIRD